MEEAHGGRSEGDGPAARARRVPVVALVLVLLAAVLSRALYASTKSLVLDEFHSFYHATHAPLSAFFGALLRDNHPPLSFLVIGTSAEVLGQGEFALRLPALVAGLVEIALVARLVRRLGGSTRAAVAAAVLLAVSGMHFDYGTQARMYAPFALALTCAVSALVEIVRGEGARGAQLTLALSVAAAFHLHYFTLQYVGVLIPAALVACAAAGEVRRCRALAAPSIGAALLSAPWAWFGLRAQLGHGLPPGGDDLGLGALAEAFMHLFAHNVSLAGETGRWAFVLAAGVGLGLAGVGLLALLRDARRRPAAIVVGAAAFLVPVASWAFALALPRAGFTWHYVLPSAAAAAALAGVGAFGVAAAARPLFEGARRAAFVAVALAGAVLVSLHLASPATEDFRGAVRFALERATDAVRAGERVELVSVEWQPPLFPQGQPYDYYAPRLAGSGAPERAAMIPENFVPSDFAPLLAADRVLVVRRSLPDGQPLVKRLTERFGPPRSTRFGYGLDVLEFD